MNLLLPQGIKVLRAENGWEIKQKASRRVTLGADLILFVHEGRNRVQQLDTHVEEQVEE